MTEKLSGDALEGIAPQPRYIEHITFEGRDCVVLSPEEYETLWEIALRAAPPSSDARAEYERKNPLGGPATMFEAMAERIRAGEDYYAVLADYGLCVVNDTPASERVGTYIKNAERAPVLLTVDGEPTLLQPGAELHISHTFVPSESAQPRYVMHHDAWGLYCKAWRECFPNSKEQPSLSVAALAVFSDMLLADGGTTKAEGSGNG